MIQPSGIVGVLGGVGRMPQKERERERVNVVGHALNAQEKMFMRCEMWVEMNRNIKWHKLCVLK